MEHLQKPLILLILAGIAAAVPAYFAVTRFAFAPVTAASVVPAALAAAPNLCFTAGSVTYRVSSGTGSADYRVKIDASHPDLRIQFVDGVESADFALVDDVGGHDTNACASSRLTKTVQVVDDASLADITMSLSTDAADADAKLFVHSERFSPRDAAALFAAMQRYQRGRQLAEISDFSAMH